MNLRRQGHDRLAGPIAHPNGARGGCERLVGVDRHANWPESVQRLPQVGGMEDANIERVVALRPDVVLLRLRSGVVNQLESLGIRVIALDARTHADVRCVMEHRAHDGRPGLGRASACTSRCTGWRRPPNAFIGDDIARLGSPNIVPASLGLLPTSSPKFVVRASPHLLMAPALVAHRDGPRPGWSAEGASRPAS